MASITGPRVVDCEIARKMDYATARALNKELFYGEPPGFMTPINRRIRRGLKYKFSKEVSNRPLRIYDVSFRGRCRDVGALDFSVDGKRAYFTDLKYPDSHRIDEIVLCTEDGKVVATLKAWGTVILHSPYSVINLLRPPCKIGETELKKRVSRRGDHTWKIVDRQGIVRMDVYQHWFRYCRAIPWTITVDTTDTNEDFEQGLIALFVADCWYGILVGRVQAASVNMKPSRQMRATDCS